VNEDDDRNVNADNNDDDDVGNGIIYDL